MIPDGPIRIERGLVEAYIVEMRSIGGLSGSPVFLRRTVRLDIGGTALHGLSTEVYLLGLAHGHWDIDERDKNKSKPRLMKRGEGVNWGFGVVIPAHKIMEVLNHPDLVAQRDQWDRNISERLSPNPD